MLPVPPTLARKRDRVVVLRRASALRILVGATACLACGAFGLAVAGWEVHILSSEMAAARHASVAAAHTNSLRLVRRALELQDELEDHEDRQREAMQLYLRLDREMIPAMRDAVLDKLDGCNDFSRAHVSLLLRDFTGQAGAQAEKILDEIDRRGAANRHRLRDLAAEVSTVARADRERLRAEVPLIRPRTKQWGWSRHSSPGETHSAGQRGLAGGNGVADVASDAGELEPPLLALAAALRRPHATFELGEGELREWSEVHGRARREGRPSAETLRRMRELVRRAPLPEHDRARESITDTAAAGRNGSDPGAENAAGQRGSSSLAGAHGGMGSAAEDAPGRAMRSFEHLLRRAQLHRHAGGLLEVLSAWEAGRADVWEVVETIERLREMRVLPMDLLRLHEHEWASVVRGASGGQLGHVAFDAVN